MININSLRWIALWFLVFANSACSADTEYPTPYGERDDVGAYLDELTAEHEFDRAALQELFAGAHFRQDIIDRISKPAETVWTWGRYRRHLVDQKRIDDGAVFYAQYKETLDRAHTTFGVAPAYVVAILGIETRYGRIKGSFSVLDALATLGFDYPPRSKFFRKELTEFLLLAREENKDPRELLGSYAGAMGYGQFISSSYRHYAVDFDNDGVRDIWNNPVDAIGSIANYFAKHHWQGDQPVAIKVGSDDDALNALSVNKLALTKTVEDYFAAGVDIPDDLDPSLKAGLFKFVTDEEDEYWLVLPDFYAISRYNHSHLYSLAVHQLALAIEEEAIKNQTTENKAANKAQETL